MELSEKESEQGSRLSEVEPRRLYGSRVEGLPVAESLENEERGEKFWRTPVARRGLELREENARLLKARKS